MKVFELRKKKGSVSSVYAIGLVADPAIEVPFVFLSKDTQGKEAFTQVQLTINEEKRMIYSPVLIPEQEIPRRASNGEAYGIKFREDTIREAAYDFITAKLTDKFNAEHVSSNSLEGVNVVENWIIEDPKRDKAITLGFDLPKGTWMQGIKVTSDATWKDVKAGKYKGISIEGIFEDYEIKANQQTQLLNKNERKMSKEKSKVAVLLNSIASFMNPKLASQTLVDGTVIYYDGDLGEGTQVFADEAMETAVPDGSYEVSENQIITVENGVVTLVEEIEMKKEEELSAENIEMLAKTTLTLVEKFNQQQEVIKEQNEKIEKLEAIQKEHVEKLKKVSSVSSKTAVKLASNSDDNPPKNRAIANFRNNVLNN